MWFSLQKDIFNYKNIFFNNRSIFFMIKIYSDDNQSALKYFKDTEADIYNILIIVRNFNIRNSDWNPLYPFHFSYNNSLSKLWTLLIFFYFYLFNRCLLSIQTTKTTQTQLSIYSFYNQIQLSSTIMKFIQNFVSPLIMLHLPLISLLIRNSFKSNDILL